MHTFALLNFGNLPVLFFPYMGNLSESRNYIIFWVKIMFFEESLS